MLVSLKKLPYYFWRTVKDVGYTDTVNILRYMKREDIVPCLFARANRDPCTIQLKEHSKLQPLHRFLKQLGCELNVFLDLIKLREKTLENGLHQWNYKGRYYFADYIQFAGLYHEYLTGAFEDHYQFNWHKKTVLDIGGFIGDSALYFLENGAKHVIIYEPLERNIEAMRYNLRSYFPQIEIHQKAVSKEHGAVVLTSDEETGSLGFGMKRGKHVIECEGLTFTQILQQHSVDVVKLDCEGAEKYLAEAPNSLICQIPYWIVETHHRSIYNLIQHKFKDCGYKALKERKLSEHVDLIHFSKCF